MKTCHWVVGIALMCCVGCGSESANQPATGAQSNVDQQSDATTRQKVAVQLNWYPEAEHGGIYQAFADQSYVDAGFEVDIRAGGRATPVAPEIQFGRVQFAIANADDVVVFREQGMDVVAVMAGTQDNPRCILVRQESGVERFEDLAGMTLQRQAGRPFLEFMRAQGLLEKVIERPYPGSVATLVADPKVAIQAYSYSEPLLAQQQGVEVRTLMVSDLGWNPYSSVLITSGELIRRDPELVGRFVRATRQGWRNYLRDPALGNKAILAANSATVTEESLSFGVQGLKTLALPEGMPEEQVGKMQAERWNTLVEHMASLKLIDPAKVKPEDCFTAQFLD